MIRRILKLFEPLLKPTTKDAICEIIELCPFLSMKDMIELRDYIEAEIRLRNTKDD